MTPKLIIILLILFVPQIFYLFKEIRYKSLDMTKKYFKRYSVINEESYEEIYLTNTDGFDLFVRILGHENPKGIVQIVHGVAEHSGNYMDFAKNLNDNCYIVVIDDHRGHGKSISTAYPNGYMKRAEEIVDDEIMIAKYIKERYPNLNYTLLGHSMGSMIARLFLRKNDNLLDKLILTGTVPVNKLSGLALFFFNIGCFFLGEKGETRIIDYLVGASGLDFISFDKDNINIKANDPFRIFKFRAGYSRVLIEINKKLGQKSKYKCKNKDLKIYNMVGESDIITKGERGIKNSLKLLKSIGYTNIENKVYKDMKHEILNETAKADVYKDVLDILEK